MKNIYLTLICLFIGTYAISQDCTISNLSVTANDCDGNFFSVTIDFQLENDSSTQFVVVGNGNNYGTFEIADLPITIGPLLGDDILEYEFGVFIPENPDCQDFVDLGPIACGPICSISNGQLELLSCQTNITALVELNFDFTNVEGNAFDLFYENGNAIGSYLYADLPVALPNFLVNGNESISIEVCDDDSECCEIFTFPAIDCNPNNCEIFNMVAEPTCDGNVFFVDIDFDFENPGNAGFVVSGNGINHGSFSYADLPITLGPLNANTTIEWEFVVTDSTKTNCSSFVELGVVNCPMACVAENLTVTTTECIDNTTYGIEINAEILNPSDSGFTLFTPGFILGSYRYEDLPVTITEFPGTGNFIDQITLCDNLNEECCITTNFEALLCAGCIIYNPTATAQPCADNGTFDVIINFDFQNEGSQGFQIGGNGNIYGQFDYDNLPITLGPFDADSSTFYEFLILDLENFGCLAAVELGETTCADICSITELSVSEVACNGADQYSLLANFDFTGENISGFDVFANGSFIGFYSGNDLPLNIQNFPAGGGDFDTITICHNDNIECCQTISFEALNCELPCTISDLEVDDIACGSDSTYRLFVNFNFENTTGNRFDIYGNEQFLGSFEKDSSSILIENMPISLSGFQVIEVCANDDSLCCESIQFVGPNCIPDPCDIRDLEIISVICDSDTTVQANIQFIHENTKGNLYDVFCDTVLIGTFEKSGDAPLEINGIRTNDSGEKTIRICANDIDNCCDQITILTPNCTPDSCSIQIVSLIPVECVSDTAFRLNVNMTTENVGTNFFDVYSQGDYVGFFEVDGNTFSIPNFPTSQTEFNEIVICRTDDLVCCDTVIFEGLVCDPELCLISDVVVETTECTSDSSFTVVLDFNFQNTGSDTFDLFGMEGYITTIVKDTGAVVLENFEANLFGEYVITICATDVNDCCADRFFEGPVCTSECTIYNLDVRDIDCMSPFEYGVLVQFDYLNLTGNAFNVFIDTSFFGTYFFDSLGFDTSAISVTNIPFTGTELVTITICDTLEELCCQTIQYEPIDCSELFCAITNLNYVLSDCDTSGRFFVELDFDVSGPSDLGFNVRGNGINYGNFQYESLPITIGPLEADTLIEYEFLVDDLETATCFDFVDIGVVNCGPVSLNPTTQIEKAQIYYIDGQPYVNIENPDTRLDIFGYDGRLLQSVSGLEKGAKIALSDYVDRTAVYILKLTNTNGLSVGKFVR